MASKKGEHYMYTLLTRFPLMGFPLTQDSVNTVFGLGLIPPLMHYKLHYKFPINMILGQNSLYTWFSINVVFLVKLKMH